MQIGTTMVVKIKENVQCRVVLIQTDKEKKRAKPACGISKIIMFSGTTKRQAKTIWYDTAKKLLQKR